MHYLAANIIVYLTRYLYFAKQFFYKNKYAYLLMDILKWEILAYSFSLVGGYQATLCYMFLIGYEVMKFTSINKVVLMDIAVFMICASFIYFSRKYHIIHLLPYIALFIQMVIKPIFKNKDKKYTNMAIDILICVYSYYYHLYVLFIFKVFQIIFPIVGTSIKGLTDFTNKRTN